MTTPHWSDRAKKFWHAWFAPDQDGNSLDDSALAYALETDGIVADFVEAARATGEDLTAALAEREELLERTKHAEMLTDGIPALDGEIAALRAEREQLMAALRECATHCAMGGCAGATTGCGVADTALFWDRARGDK